jgi:chromosome segregation ATPase
MDLTKTMIAELQAKNEADRAEHSRHIEEVRAEHTKEIDDLLKQLDLVEAEHNDNNKKNNDNDNDNDTLIQEKDAVISALGSQLAQAEKRSEVTNATQGIMTKQMESLQQELQESKAEIASTQQEMDHLLADHKRAMEEELVLRQKLCEEAREEMIQRAEVQFEQVNGTYKKLKHEFDHVVSNNSDLERELKLTKKKAEDMKNQQEAREVDLADELAEAKAGTYNNFLSFFVR